MIINDGFIPKRQSNPKIPPGQYVVSDFPVLSFGPTQDISTNDWKLEIAGLVGVPQIFIWAEFEKLPHFEMKTDIHCVTKWSKLDTTWQGVDLDYLMKISGVSGRATHIIAHSYDGYTTNLPIEDVQSGKAMVATSFEGNAITAPHGGPARLFIPHLYFWKSAKWLSKFEFVDGDKPGFWETRGYHNYGNPWLEQRYDGD